MLSRMILTKSRTPTLANITFPGGNTCRINMRMQIPYKVHVMKLTGLTASPREWDSICRTFTVGLSHFVHRSSLLGDRSSPCACLWRTARIALRELQSWSSTASGWERRWILVRFSYAFRALSTISWKLVDEVVVVVVVVGRGIDIRACKELCLCSSWEESEDDEGSWEHRYCLVYGTLQEAHWQAGLGKVSGQMW